MTRRTVRTLPAAAHPVAGLFGAAMAACLAALLPLAALAAATAPAPALSAHIHSTAPGLRILSQGANELLLELFTPPELVDVRRDAIAGCDVVEVGNYQPEEDAGGRLLPVKSALIGVPEGEAAVEIVESDTVVIEGRFDICSGPEAAGAAHGGAPSLNPPAAEVIPAGRLRDQHAARLVLRPLQYDVQRGQVRLATRLRVAIHFAWPARAASPAATERPESPAFAALLDDTLLNAAQARAWRQAPPAPSQTAPLVAVTPLLKLVVGAGGMQRLAYHDVQAAGLDPDSLDPRMLRLFNRGQEIAFRVAGEDDGRFDPGDLIEFYGEALSTKYTDSNVYWLAVGASPGLRMPLLDGRPQQGATRALHVTATIRIEENHMYWPTPSASTGLDYWYWTRLVGGEPQHALEIPLALPAAASGNLTATLRVAVKSRWDDLAVTPDHHLRISLGNRLLADERWDGELPKLIEASFPQAAANSALLLDVPGDTGSVFDAIYIDWLEVDYRRTLRAEGDSLQFGSPGPGMWRYDVGGFSLPDIAVYDVTDPAQPAQISSDAARPTSDGWALSFQDALPGARQYLITSPAAAHIPQISQAHDTTWLRSAANGADYIIITPADFYTATAPLADHRRSQGLRTLTVTTSDLYDEFSHGIFDPAAIHDFLAYAYTYWQSPAPSYVVLVGDGSVDFHDYLGTGEANYLPPMLAQVDPSLGETMTDNRYVTISGDDPLPDMFIGRLPAASAGQVSVMVEKTILYEEQSANNTWRRHVTFVADNADSAGDFAALSDALMARLPEDYAGERIYLGVTHATAAAARQDIIDAFGRGPLFVNYAGHASVQLWGIERLLSTADVDALATTPTPPILLAWSCYEGWFAYPGYQSLDESLMRVSSGGIVAGWSPSGLGSSPGHHALAQHFLDAVFSSHAASLGQATTLAKVRLYAGPAWNHDLIDTYLVFGDPALVLPVDRPRITIHLPIVVY